MYDPERYRDKGEIERWRERDPIPLFAARCVADELLTEQEVVDLDATAARTVDEAVAFAEAGTPEPVDQLTRLVVSDPVGMDGGDA